MTTTPRTTSFALLSLLCLAPACTEQIIEPLGAATQATCGQTVCGSNSPLLGEHAAAESHQSPTGTHLQNQTGVRLLQFRNPDGTPATYQVEDNGALVILGEDGAVTHSGAEVVGATFFLEHRGEDSVRTDFELVIQDYHQIHTYWVGRVETLPSYYMEYSINGDSARRTPLCTGPYEGDPNTNPETMDVFLSTGERYDFDTRDIFDTGTASDGWTNFACVGDGLSKMLQYRHRPEPSVAPPYSTEESRQALLRMWAADYCGNGDSFTTHGQKLTWRDRHDLMTEDSSKTSVEAVWTPNGAACLNTPRYEGSDPSITKAYVESVCAEKLNIENFTIPSCNEPEFSDSHPTGLSWKSNSAHYFKTWNLPE